MDSSSTPTADEAAHDAFAGLSVTPAAVTAVKQTYHIPLRDRLKALVPSIVAAMAALVAIVIVVHVPGPTYSDPGMLAFMLALVIIFPLVLLLTLAIHEGGHLAGAAAAGLEFRLVTVGPWRLAREQRGLRLSFVRRNLLQWQGNAFCIPYGEHRLRARLIVFILGGPAATLAQTAVALLLRAKLADAPVPYWLAQTTFLFAYCPLAILPFTLFPMRFRGVTTDAAQLLILWRQTERFARRAAVNLLVAASIRGSRPRELDPAQLAVLTHLPPDAEEAQFGYYLAYLHALDMGDVPAAGRWLDLALRPFATQPDKPLTPAYVLAAAAFEARHGAGTAVGQEWLNLLPRESYNALAIENEQMLWQTRAIVSFAAGENAQAHRAAQRSLLLVPRLIEKGQAVVAEEVLGEILSATGAAAAEEKATFPGGTSDRNRWPAWGRGLALPVLALGVILALGVMWGNGRFSQHANQSQTYYQTGMTRLEDGRYQEAILAFDAAIHLNAGLDDAYWGRGQAYFALNQHTAAIHDFDRALQLQGERPNPWIYFYRGLSHTYLGHYPEAANDYQRLANTATDEHLRLAADHYLREINRLAGENTPEP
ncbi:MAG: tetratricopeptide repeat protein [Anaerolineales bacterium]|nr:tetratricopeptide repeat protein [Anaerolineales bacterium]